MFSAKYKVLFAVITISLLGYTIKSNIALRSEKKRLTNNIVSYSDSIRSIQLSRNELKTMLKSSNDKHFKLLDSLMNSNNIKAGQLQKANIIISEYKNQKPLIISQHDTIIIDRIDTIENTIIEYIDDIIMIDDGCWSLEAERNEGEFTILSRGCNNTGVLIDYSKRERHWYTLWLRIGKKESKYIMESKCGSIEITEIIKR